MNRLRAVVLATERAERSRYSANIEVEQAVLDVERLVDAGKLQARAGAIHFVVHARGESDRFRRPGRALARARQEPRSRRLGVARSIPRRGGSSDGHEMASSTSAESDAIVENFLTAVAPLLRDRAPAAAESAACPSKFPSSATSISEIRIAGATADTGTEPDSAPQ